jgi:hypothetical protein
MKMFKLYFFSVLLFTQMFSCTPEEENKHVDKSEEKEIILFGYSSARVLLAAASNSTRYQFSSVEFGDTVQIKIQDGDQGKFNLITASGINLIDITLDDTFLIEENQGAVKYKGIVTHDDFFLKKVEEKTDTTIITEYSAEPILKAVISDTLSIDPLNGELFANQTVLITGKNLNENLKLLVDRKEIAYTLKDSTGLEFTLPEASTPGIYKIEILIDETLIFVTTVQGSSIQKYTGKFPLYGYHISTSSFWPNIGNSSSFLTSVKSSDTLFIEKDSNDPQKVNVRTNAFDIGSVVVNDSFYVEVRKGVDLTQIWGVVQESASYVKFRLQYRGKVNVWEYTTTPDQLPYEEVLNVSIGTFAANLYPGKKFKVTGKNLKPDLEASINGIGLKKEYLEDSLMSFEGPELPVNQVYNIEFKLYGVSMLKKQVVITEETPSDPRLKRLPVVPILQFTDQYIMNFSPDDTPLMFFNNNLYEFDESTYALIHKSTFNLNLLSGGNSWAYGKATALSFEIGTSAYILKYSGNIVSFHRYEIESNQWTKLGDAPFTSLKGSFVIGGKAYVISDYLWEYAPDDNSWIKESQIPETGNAGFSFSLNGNGYFGDVVTNVFYQYDPSTDGWERMPDFNFENSQSGPKSVGQNFRHSIVLGNKVYLFSAKRNEVLSFDGVTWSKAFDFYSFNWTQMILFEQNNKLYFGQGHVNINQELFFYDDFWEFIP